jgi:hypothetical protein
VRRIVWAIGVLLLAAAVVPELFRYRAERRLREASMALVRVLTTPMSPADATAALESSAAGAAAAAPALGDDPRPWIVGGSARLVSGRLQDAIASYREGLRRCERAEIDLNIGRAREAGGEADAAVVGYVRAGWISPPMLNALSGQMRERTDAEIARLDAALRAGTLAAPPPPAR